MHHAASRTPQKMRGLAISIILLVVVLLAGIAVTIALSSRASAGNAGTQQARLNAASLMSEASNLHMGFDRMQANNIDAGSITFDTATTAGLFNPGIGGTVQQFPPAAAYQTPPGTPQWYFNQNVKLEGVGTSNADYVVLITNISSAVCNSIMMQLYGMATPIQSAAATATIANLTSNAAVDFTSDANHATQNRPEGCFGDVTGNSWVYYKAVVEN